jgi:hypothetical protein
MIVYSSCDIFGKISDAGAVSAPGFDERTATHLSNLIDLIRFGETHADSSDRKRLEKASMHEHITAKPQSAAPRG